MESSSTESRVATSSEKKSPVRNEAEISQRVSELAEISRSRSDFLKLLANEFAHAFGASVVAVQADDWTDPMMLIADGELAQTIRHDEIRQLLESSSIVPVACDIAIVDSKLTAENLENDSLPQPQSRGLRVEIMPSPRRAAVLLAYPRLDCPTVAGQVRDLKRLNCYIESSRLAIGRLDHSIEHEGSQAFTNISTDTSTHNRHPIRQEAALPVNRSAARQSLQHFHRDLDLNSSASRIANESRRLLGCDRVSVLVYANRTLRVHAISGVAVVDRRSNTVQALETLSNLVAVFARPVLVPDDESLPTQLQGPVNDYLDESGVVSMLALPLASADSNHRSGRLATDLTESDHLDHLAIDPFNSDGEPLGMMVLEYFSGSAPGDTNESMRVIATEASLALRNSLEHHRVFGKAIGKSIGRVVDSVRSPVKLLLTTCVVGFLVAASLIRVDHHVAASGSVGPLTHQNVFAEIDGRVTKVLVEDGQKVDAGDPLFELENAELDLRAESLVGELKTATERLSAIESLRLSPQSDPTQTPRLAIEEGQLRSELANLRTQQALIGQQQAALTVRSPINGTVVGWQLERRLGDRPVQRGNVLAGVANTAGPWALRLDIPDRDAGPILEAMQQDTKRPIQFSVATQPDSSFSAELQSIASVARKDEFGELVIEAIALVEAGEDTLAARDAFQPARAKIGADVRARIVCEKRSVLHSWFGDVLDFANRHVLFYFR